MAAGTPEVEGHARREIADIAAAQDRERPFQAGREKAKRFRRLRREADRVRVWTDVSERAVEVEEQRIARPQTDGGKIAEGDHGQAGTVVGSSACRNLRRHQPMSCSRTAAIMSLQRSTRSSRGMTSARWMASAVATTSCGFTSSADCN